MKFGLQVPSFSYPGGTPDIAPTLERIVRTADEVGFDSIWVMDHLFQIRSVGAVDEPMLEGWTALGWIGAMTKRARIGLMVGGIPYRLPAIWVKAATTLDVLTGGRAWLGLGAAWNQQESDALGIPFPPLVNNKEAVKFIADVAAEIVGEDNMNREGPFVMASEDFSYMLEKVPGAFINIGNGGGEGGCEVHNPGYDFNDEIITLGATLWSRVVETKLSKDAR